MRPAAKRLIRIPALAGALAVASALTAGWVSGADTGRAAGVLVLARVVASLVFRFDRLAWRELTFRDAVTAALACAGGSAIAAAACVALPGPWPARLLAADLAIYPCLLLGGAAMAGLSRLKTPNRGVRSVRTLIWGAGSEGRALLERIRRRHPDVEVFGWLDDDAFLSELELDGTPVLGPLESLPLLVELHGVQAVLVAIPRLSPARRALAEDLARWSGAGLVLVPDVSDSLGALARRCVPAGLVPFETRR